MDLHNEHQVDQDVDMKTNTSEIQPSVQVNTASVERKNNSSKQPKEDDAQPVPTSSQIMNDQDSGSKKVKSIFPLLKLPPPIVNQIFYYFLPFPAFNLKASDRLAKLLLPLALTNKTFFKSITRQLVNFIENDPMVNMWVCTYYEETPSYNVYLYRCARLALNIMMIEDNIDIKQSFDLKPEDYENKASTRAHCDQNAPLFSVDGHSEHCRIRLAWITLAIFTGKLKELKFFSALKINKSEFCAIHLLTILGYPVRKLILSDCFYVNSPAAEMILMNFFAMSATTLEEITIDIANVEIVHAFCNVKHKSLKYLHLKDNSVLNLEDHENRKLLRFRFKRILRHISKYDIQLTSLSVQTRFFLVWKDEEEAIDIASLVPSLRYLEIVKFHPFIHEEDDDLYNSSHYERSLQYCSNIEILEFKDANLSLKDIYKARKSGSLERLKQIKLTRMTSLRGSNRLKDDPEYIDTLNLIDHFDIWNKVSDAFLKTIHYTFPSIKVYSIRVTRKSLPLLCPLLSEHRNLVDLSIYVEKDFSEEDHERNGHLIAYDPIHTQEMYYSHHLIEAITKLSSSKLESIQVFGCYATFDEAKTILRELGERAKVFRFHLSDEFHGYDQEQYIGEYSISAEQVMGLIQTVGEYCPNIEKLNITSILTWVYWKKADVKMVRFKLKKTLPLLKKFDSWSFVRHFGMRYDDPVLDFS